MERDEFLSALRTALMQLDDLQSLRESPLLPLFCDHTNPVAFQQRLLDAIEALRHQPLSTTAAAYELLNYRFVEQMNQDEVAFQLGVSVRQLRRMQHNAIELLADLLWKEAQATGFAGALPALAARATDGETAALDSEIAWLAKGAKTEVTDVYAVIEQALVQAAVLASHHQVQLIRDFTPGSVLAPIPVLVLRQALLALLTTAIQLAPGQTVCVAAKRLPSRLRFSISAQSETAKTSVDNRFHASLATIRELLAPFGGDVRLQLEAPYVLSVDLPTVDSISILVIDDNPDVRQLLQRYAANTRFSVIATDQVDYAIQLAQQHSVRVLLLDVMMPEQDGWDILAQWRHHPATQEIPVVICTILPQEALAALLGAAAFLKKPVSREAFLALLERLVVSSPQMPG